jgi:hypothetical protein
MNAPANNISSGAPPLLDRVIGELQPLLGRDSSIKERLLTFWSVLVESRDLGSSDVIADEFRNVAEESGLTDDVGKHGIEDIEHIISWGLRGFNPFEKGPLHA